MTNNDLITKINKVAAVRPEEEIKHDRSPTQSPQRVFKIPNPLGKQFVDKIIRRQNSNRDSLGPRFDATIS